MLTRLEFAERDGASWREADQRTLARAGVRSEARRRAAGDFGRPLEEAIPKGELGAVAKA